MADTELKEKVHMSRLMVEERVWFSLVSNALKSVLVSYHSSHLCSKSRSLQDNEVTLTNDLERLPQLIEEMTSSTSSPSILPEPVRDYIEVRKSSITYSTVTYSSVRIGRYLLFKLLVIEPVAILHSKFIIPSPIQACL